MKSAVLENDAVPLPCRQVVFNHYILAICILIGSTAIMRPVMPVAMQFTAFVSPHFIKVPAFVRRNSSVMKRSSAGHFIAKLIVMQSFRFISVPVTMPEGLRFFMLIIISFAITYLG